MEISWEEYQRDFPQEIKELWNTNFKSRPKPPYYRNIITGKVATQEERIKQLAQSKSACSLVAGIFLFIYAIYSFSATPFFILLAIVGSLLFINGALRLRQEARVERGLKGDSIDFVKTVVAGMVQAENKINIKELSKDLRISLADLRTNILRLISEGRIAGTVDGDYFFPTGEASQVAEILMSDLNKTVQIDVKKATQEQAMLPKTPISADVDFKSVMLGMAKAEGKVNLAFLSKKFGIKLKPMKKKIYGLIGANQLVGKFEGDYFYPSMEITQAIDKLFDEFSRWGSEKKI